MQEDMYRTLSVYPETGRIKEIRIPVLYDFKEGRYVNPEGIAQNIEHLLDTVDHL